jgi:hypothetical protein
MSCDHEFGGDTCPKCGIALLPDGCGYQGYEFGASYPDSICYGGRLWNADLCDNEGNLLEPGEDIPCPMCNPRGAIQYWAQVNRNSGMKRDEARVAAKSLVDDIRKNRATGTEPWKKRVS